MRPMDLIKKKKKKKKLLVLASVAEELLGLELQNS
jgi:hypothetical protein